MSWATCMAARDTGFFLYVLSHESFFLFLFLMAVVWPQCDRRCGARHTRSVKTPPCDPRGHAVHGELQCALLTGPQPQCIGLPAAEARQFFRYCLGLRGGGSSHFAPICTAKLRRDQSSGGGGWDKCNRVPHQPPASVTLSLSAQHTLANTCARTHTQPGTHSHSPPHTFSADFLHHPDFKHFTQGHSGFVTQVRQ